METVSSGTTKTSRHTRKNYIYCHFAKKLFYRFVWTDRNPLQLKYKLHFIPLTTWHTAAAFRNKSILTGRTLQRLCALTHIPEKLLKIQHVSRTAFLSTCHSSVPAPRSQTTGVASHRVISPPTPAFSFSVFPHLRCPAVSSPPYSAFNPQHTYDCLPHWEYCDSPGLLWHPPFLIPVGDAGEREREREEGT